MVWPHAVESDYREPLWQCSLPALLSSWTSLVKMLLTNGSGDITEGSEVGPYSEFGFFWMSEAYWIEIQTLVCCECLLAALTGAIVYKCVVEPKKTETTTAKLLIFGLLLPVWIVWPTFIYQALNLRNYVIKFVVGVVTPTITLFRLTETIYGCTPVHAKQSLTDFVVYFASALIFRRDETTKALLPATWKQKLQHLQQFVGLLFLTGALQSIVTPYADLNVFGPPISRDGWFAVERVFSWQLYANSLLHAALFQLYLSTYSEGLTFFWYTVIGYQTMPVMKNPLGSATSPSDFWGQRWNLVIHSVLKGGVYKPVRSMGYSPIVGVMATFFASGLFHEWLVFGLCTSACKLDPAMSRSCYHPQYGGSMAFFTWQAMLLAGEFTLGRTKLVTSITHHIPVYVRTALIIAMGIPLAHFFTEPYVRSDFFRHGQIGLPMILRLNDTAR